MIEAIVIEDEKNTRATLIALIKSFCPIINLIGEADSVSSGISLIKSRKPNLIFLDIKLGNENSFKILDETKGLKYEVIFTTAYENYALKAIKHACFDYLLKPIDIKELQQTVARFAIHFEKIEIKEGQMNTQAKSPILNASDKIGLATNDGITYVKKVNIMYCKADGPYTTVFTIEGKKFTIAKTLKLFLSNLATNEFKRCHRSYAVNLLYIERYERENGGFVILKNNKAIPISRRLKSQFLESLQ